MPGPGADGEGGDGADGAGGVGSEGVHGFGASGDLGRSGGSDETTGRRRSANKQQQAKRAWEALDASAQSKGVDSQSTTAEIKSAASKSTVRRRYARLAKAQSRRFKDGQGHPYPRIRALVKHQAFEGVVVTIIIANCVFIGFQANANLPGTFQIDDSTEMIFSIVEHMFTACFFTDLILRILACGWTWCLDSENWIDVGLVVLSVTVTWILVPMGIDVEVLRKLTVLRTLRLVRIARAVRTQPRFQEMWSLLKGLVNSAETLCWTYVIICIFLYFFSISATSLIGKQDQFQNNTYVQLRFGDVPRSMLTLFQVMTLDSWSSLARDVMQGEQAWIGFFFVFFITIGDFVLMNLITAVIVENSFDETKSAEKERAVRMARQREVELEELKRFFKAIDMDGSGLLSKEELMAASQKRNVRQKLRKLDVLPKDLDELWDILDDGDGELTVEEFVSGIQRLRGEAKAKDVMRLWRDLRIFEGSVKELTLGMDVAEAKMTNVGRQLKRAKTDIASMHRTLARVKDAVQMAAHSQPLS